ncbi:aminopeptidase N [Lutibaculum baratangense]|nr:aminopeptidase N [Lutibaculum baratangense]
MTTDGAPRIRLSDYRPPNHLVDAVELDIRLEPERTQVRSRLSLRPNPERPGDAPLVLDGEDLEILAIMLDGIPLARSEFVVSDRGLTIAAVPDRPFTLETTVLIDPSANTRLMGLYRSNGVYCTQCEAEGFRRITFFPDRPDVLSVYTTRIEARKSDAPVLLGNGNRSSAGDVPGTDRHFAIWHDPFPKPSYLFALVGGDLGRIVDGFTTQSGRQVRLGIYVEKGKEDRARYAMDALKRSMRWDEEVFGREYDLDVFNIVAVSDFNMGAMENKGLNIFNDRYVLASAETATDHDFASVEAVIAHEYFHNWTGNRITCRDWFQLCLKEGLTVFRDQEFTSDMRSRAVKRIQDVRLLRSHQFVEDSGPLAHPVRPETYREINNFYTATVYEKGAEVIRMLKALLGPDAFARGMNLYFKEHDGRAATVEDFLACFEKASRRDLTQFKLWYSQAGTPELAASVDQRAAEGTLEITFEQSVPATPGQPKKEPMVLPIAMGLVGEDGRDMLPEVKCEPALKNGVFELDRQRATIRFSGLKERAVPSLLRGFSAPVRLVSNLGSDDMLRLGALDSDPFNRWQALHAVMMKVLLDHQSGRSPEGSPTTADLVAALAQVGADEALDPAFRALVLSPPGDTDLTREVGHDVDPDAVHHAVEWLRELLGRQLGSTLEDIYRRHASNEPYSPDATSAAHRALRNAVLSLLVATGGDDATSLAGEHYRRADNMTDRMAGLLALSRLRGPVLDEALEDFYGRFRDDTLVLDKWFTVQAIAPDEDALDRVERLTGHPRFAMSNPNRVRALVGAFASGNPVQFNRKDGRGYAFLADHVLKLDRQNPQLAARLLSSFRSWRVLEPQRRELARRELERVAGMDGLSRDVADIAERSLG